MERGARRACAGVGLRGLLLRWESRLDARVIVDREAVTHPVKPYSHLALRPYPEEYVSGVAVRFCTIDYDREMALVAEIEDGGRRKLIGVGRLVAAPDMEVADYSVLVVRDLRGDDRG